MKTIIIYDAKILKTDLDFVEIARMDDIDFYHEK